ncbi:TNF receptor-associated factor 3-like [Corticium candelabrum]|uniref:TNF receptor-associated factor 3-like n=1 Tax=Corticium candelabrum TaxID=121492 RepID=UPI002E273978|nr:TNF receptor-associated factor 3-like [Corticium candelabrum]
MTCCVSNHVTRCSNELDVSRSAVVELKRRVETSREDHDVATQTNRRLQIELASKLPFIENKMVELEAQQRLMQHKTIQACYQSVDNVQKECREKVKGMEQHLRLLTKKLTDFEDIVWKQSTRIQQLEGMLSHCQTLRSSRFIDQVEAQERVTATHNARLSEQGLRLDLLDCKNTNGVLLWKITDVKRRRRDAVMGKTSSIYSQPFYTSTNGYKLCARMYLNGDGMGRGTHLSLFVVVMRGEYDVLLEWPFQHKITLILIDQNSRRQICDAFRPDPTSSSFQRPRSDMNVASGCPLFCPLTTLDSGGYIREDAMFVKIVVDCSNVIRPEAG